MSGCVSDGKRVSEQIEYESKYVDTLLAVEKTELRIGRIKKSQTSMLKFNVNMTNISNDIIKFNKVDVSCGCVVIRSYPEQLMIGQKGYLNGEIHLDNQDGHVHKNIFVNYNDSCLTVIKIIGDVYD